ncbi:MAG TPA: glycosyltransferase family 39 protein, partial [Chloroflexota bacterium]
AHPVFFTGDQGREPLHIYLQAITIALIGPSPLALRLPSAVLGILTVAATYATFRAFAGRRVGLIGAGLLGASYWHLSLSRLAFRADSLPLFTTLAMFWLWKGIRTGRARYFAVGGALLGIDLYTYIPARLAPVLVGLWLLGALGLDAWRAKTSRPQILAGGAVALVALLLVAAPLARYFILHPADFVERIQNVSAGPAQLAPVPAVVTGFAQAGQALVWVGDPNPRHNLPGRPLIDLPLSLLGAFGLILALRRWRDGTSLFVVVWCLGMLGPAALSAEPAHALRLVGELPFILLLPALALDWLARQLRSFGPLIGPALAGLVVLGSGVATAHDYFQVWAARPDAFQVFQSDLLDSLALVDRVPAGQTTLVTADTYEGVAVPVAFVSKVRARARAFDGRNTLVEPAAGAGPTYYVYASSMLPPGGLPSALHLTQLDLTRNRLGQPAGTLYRVDSSQPALPARRELVAEIASAVNVTGADLPPQVHPGESATIALHWTVRGQLPPGGWEFFAHLVDRRQQRLWAADYNQGFPIDQWRSGDQVISWFSLPVPADAPAAVADVDFGIFDSQTGQRLPVTTPGGAPAGDRLVVGPLRIARPQSAPAPDHPLVVHFGQAISLLGYDLARPGDGSVSLRLHWRADQPVDLDYT